MRPITKQEEQRAFQYIKDVLVPRAVQTYNSSPKTERKFTPDEIRAVLKKHSNKPDRPDEEGGPVIEYFARIQEPNSNFSYVFGFTITRAGKGLKHPGRIMVHCRHPIAAVCGTYLQESTDVDSLIPINPERERKATITKIEEARGLQYIRERIVPMAAIRWNNAVYKSKLQNKEQYKVTAEEINKRLVKKSHYVHNPGDRTRRDHILYQSTPVKPFTFKGPFQFSLSKDNFVDELSVAAALPGSEDWVTYYIDDRGMDAMFNLTIKPIRRGTHIKENLDVPDDPLNVHQFSRREEGEIVQYLKLVVIPYLVERKNKILWQQTKRRHNFKVPEVQRSLRKVGQNDTKHCRMLVFKAEGQNQTYNLMVYKDGEGDTLVYNKDNAAIYQVGRPIKPDTIDTGEYFDNLTESRSISKMEEAEFLQSIRNRLIPVIVKMWNQRWEHGKGDPMGKKVYSQFRAVTPEEVSKNLRKVEHGKHAKDDLTTTDVLYYLSPIEPNWAFGFQVYKRSALDEKPIVGITLPDGDLIFKDPRNPALTESKQVDRTMVPMPERCKMTQRDIAQALQFIRQTVLPHLVVFNNEKNPVDMDGYKLLENLKLVQKGEDMRHVLSVKGDIRTGEARSLTVPYEFVVFRTNDNHKTVEFKVEKDFAGNMQLKILANQIHSVPTQIPKLPMLFEAVDFSEPPDETNLMKISPKEEKEALQYIRRYIVPMAVQAHNGYANRYSKVTEEEVQQNLRLSGRYPQHGIENPSIAFTSVPRGKYFAFMVGKQLQKEYKEYGKMYVTYRTPDQFNPHSWVVGEPPKPLYEAIKVKHAAAPRVIDKMEENRALQYIRNILIPAAWRYYNNQVMGEFQVRTESDIRKALRKIDVQYRPDSFYETISYVALVPTIGGKKIQKFEFYTRKPNRPGLENKTRCGVHVDGYGSQEFYLGEPTVWIG